MSLVVGLTRLGFDVVLVEALPEGATESRDYLTRTCATLGIEGYAVGHLPPPEVVDRAEAASRGPVWGSARRRRNEECSDQQDLAHVCSLP